MGTVLPEVWKPHRLPTDIISHMEAKLSGEYWQSLCKILALKQHMSTAYHPQSDRQTERTNQVLEGYLRTIVNYDQNYWYQLLPLVDHTYNNSATNPHKMTTCFAKTIFHVQTEWMKERGAQNRRPTMYADLMQDIHRQGRHNLENTRESMKKYYPQKATQQQNIIVGDLVILNTKNIGTKRPSKHLSLKLYGPFKVLEQKECMAYKLEISPRWKIHPCSQFPFWNLTDPQTDRSANSNPGIPLISRET